MNNEESLKEARELGNSLIKIATNPTNILSSSLLKTTHLIVISMNSEHRHEVLLGVFEELERLVKQNL